MSSWRHAADTIFPMHAQRSSHCSHLRDVPQDPGKRLVLSKSKQMSVRFSLKSVLAVTMIIALTIALVISNSRSVVTVVTTDHYQWKVPSSVYDSSRWDTKTIPPFSLADAMSLLSKEVERLNKSDEHKQLKESCARCYDWDVSSIALVRLDFDRWAYLVIMQRDYFRKLTEFGGLGDTDERAYWISMKGEIVVTENITSSNSGP